jgi:Holliday junction resolvase RusA-like endonuclease
MISFTVPGRVPSKANFRWSNSARARQAWKQIKDYEHQVGLAALAAGALGVRSKLKTSAKARVKVLLVNQKVDLDNALKSPIDGLKGVCLEDDSPKYLEAIQVCWAEDDGPARAEYQVEYE